MYHRFTISTLVQRLGLGASCGPALKMQCDNVRDLITDYCTRRSITDYSPKTYWPGLRL